MGIRKAKIIIEACGLSITPEEWVKMANETSWAMLEAEVVDLMPGVTRLIEHLHANNVPIGNFQVFSKNLITAAISTGSTETSMKLKRAGHEKLFDKFEFIVCCSTDPEVKQGKPHPDAFDVARRRFNPIPDPEKCLAFEDSTNGVKSAISAGMQCVMVPGNF